MGDALEWTGRTFSSTFKIQSYLLDEFLGRFHGPARRYWYLTDGGHFENTGVYELIRRQLPLIICIDNGADPEYKFQDLGNLVRRARTDFGADIRFLSPEQRTIALNKLTRASGQAAALLKEVEEGVKEGICCIGSDKSCMHQAVSGDDKCHLRIGHIKYGSTEKCGLLLWVKPCISGDEDFDVIEYGKSHPDFPQESTADQFFDEAQWESYRRLGEHSGDKLAELLKKLLPPLSPPVKRTKRGS
jgi:hypothetical protein